MISSSDLLALKKAVEMWLLQASVQWDDYNRERILAESESIIVETSMLIPTLLDILTPWNGGDGLIGGGEDSKYVFTSLETVELNGSVYARLRCTLSSRSEEANPPYEEGANYVDARVKAIAAYDRRYAARHEQRWQNTLDLHVLGDSE